MSRRKTLRALATLTVFVLVVVALQAAEAAVTGAGTAATALLPPPPDCWHDSLSVYHCGPRDTMRSVDSMVLAIYGKKANGSAAVQRRALPKTTDAIFLSKYSVEQMLLRYYVATSKMEGHAARAEELRRLLANWDKTQRVAP